MGGSSKKKNSVKKQPVYELIRKLVESKIGAPTRKRVKRKVNDWYRLPYVPEIKDTLFIEFTPLQAKKVSFGDVRTFVGEYTLPKLEERRKKIKESISQAKMKFKQKRTQGPYFDLAINISHLLSKLHELRDLHISSEVNLYIPTGENDSKQTLEIGQRDLFMHGMAPNHDRKGISVEIESEFNRSSLRKLLYALYDTVHVDIRGKLEPVSLLHHIILTKYISGYAYKMFNLKHFEDPEDIRGAFDLPTIYGKILSDPRPLSDIITFLLDAHESDPVGVSLHFGDNLEGVLKNLEKMEKKLVEGKGLGDEDRKALVNVLEKLRRYNLWRNSISFNVTPEMVKELKKDKKFLGKLVDYISQRQFPTDLKENILREWSEKGDISEVALSNALNHLARHARKTLQRTVIVHVPEEVDAGGNRRIKIDKVRIIMFKRLGKEYRLVPVIMTMRNYLDLLKKEEWKAYAEALDKHIKEGSPVNIALYKRGGENPIEIPKKRRKKSRKRKGPR